MCQMYRRYFKEDDYNTIKTWWKDWGWQPIPLEFLPEVGIIIGDTDGDVCAVFLYKTDTPIYWAENFISDPKVAGSRRKEAMQMLLEEMQEEVKVLGGKVIMSAVRHNHLARKLEANDFVKADAGLTNYIKGVV